MADHSHAFPTSVRLLDMSEAELMDFHDPDNGFLIGDEILPPAPNHRQARLKSARVGGSFAVGARVLDDGVLIVPISITGDTWAAMQARYVAMCAVLASEVEFYVETELSGVTTRWYTDAPVDVYPDPVTGPARTINSLDYELRFLVQPNPVVTFA